MTVGDDTPTAAPPDHYLPGPGRSLTPVPDPAPTPRHHTETSNDALNSAAVAAVEGDEMAAEHLLAALQPMIVRYCRARVGRNGNGFAAADHLARTVCLAVLTALPTHVTERRPLLPLVYGVARHVIANSRHTSTAASLEHATDGRHTALIRTLPARQREVLTLRVAVGLSVEDTALATGLTPDAVRAATHQAMAGLRRRPP